MSQHQQYIEEREFSFKSLFVPLTTLKAIHWIIIIGVVVFSNMLLNGFVWDDKSYIILNPQIYPFNLFALFGHNIFNAIGQYRPIPAIYFAGIFTFFKDAQFFYHLPQLLLHIINSILVFKLFSKFFNKPISFFASLFFLIHPLQVESVSFISATISPLFFLFGICALLISIKKTQTTKDIFSIFFLLLLSLLTKETAILFLLMILIYMIIFNKKLSLTYLWYGLITVFTHFIIRFFVGGVGFYRLVLIPIVRLSLPERLINIPAMIYYYISNLFFPNNLSHNQLWLITKIDFNTFYFPFITDSLFFSTLIILGFIIFKKSKKIFKIYCFFSCWFILGLGAHLQIIPLDETVADRWFYFPLVGVIGIFATLAQQYKASFIKYLNITIIITVGLLAAFSVRTAIRNSDWVNGITLYTHDMRISNNFDIEDNLGTEYFEKADYKQAIIHFKKSYEMFPYEVNAYNIALAYIKADDFTNAEIYFDKSLQEKDYAETIHEHELGNYERYTQLLLHLKKYEKAIEITNRGIKDYPNESQLWMFLAYARYQKGDKKKSLEDAQKAINLDPNSPQAQALRDNILYSKQIYLNPIR